MHIADLLHALTLSDHHRAVNQRRRLLKEITRILPQNTEEGDLTFVNTLRAVLMYDEEYGRTPSVQSLRDYATIQPHSGKTFGLAESVKLELDFLLPLWKDYGAERSDIDVLIDGVRQESRELLWLSAASRFKQILLAGETIATGPDKGQTRRGPEAALEHMQRIKALDIQAESNELSGRLHENTHAIEAMLRAYLNGQQTHVRLGFSRIDRYWVVNFGKVMVVAGAPGDGKTTFVNSVVYNLLKAGERVLYICTSDHSPEETWQHFAFLFAKEFRQRRTC
jgi:primosomal protein N'